VEGTGLGLVRALSVVGFYRAQGICFAIKFTAAV
jgi:hypothetical protein